VKPRVLIIDDDPLIRRLVRDAVQSLDATPLEAADGAAAKLALAADDGEVSCTVLDLGLPDISGRELLRQLRQLYPEMPVVVLTQEGAIEAVVECMQAGASDYVHKPFDRTRLTTALRHACESWELRARLRGLTAQVRRQSGFATIIGDSPPMRRMVSLLRKAAGGDVTLLLAGESGTGKEIAARAVHAESDRCGGPFIAVNCGAIPDTLIESELFGHERGAFTGAHAARRGRFEEAHGGTIFLDEVGELRVDLQSRLLRVLQERVVQRVGGGAERPVDLRVIAATNRDLKVEIGCGAFREDLYYRLAVFPVEMPPLRTRGEDLFLLARFCLRRFSERYRKPLAGFTERAELALRAYDWPGNVRELENVLERAVILEDGDQISLGSLTDDLVCALEGQSAVRIRGATGGRAASGPSSPADVSAAEEVAAPAPQPVIPFADEERRIIRNALAVSDWNVRTAAASLGIGRATIYRKIERYGLAADRE
jgi:DNA-binding NtrC family response regulator